MRTLIKNANLIATLDADGRRMEGGSLLVEDGRIHSVLKAGDTAKVDKVVDAKGKMVTPGLVNTHHHFYQTLTRNLPGGQDEKLFAWLKFHYPIWRGLDEEMVALSTRTALAELLLSGCTFSSDHHYVFPQDAAPDLIDRQIEVARELGIRFQPTRGSMSLGESAGGLPPDDLCQSEAVILDDSRRLLNRYHDDSEEALIRVDLAPCSPFSVTNKAMVETAALAREAGCRLHTHLAETLDEESFCLRETGKRPYELMKSLAWTGADVWFAHAVHLNDEEIAAMADSGTGMSHCPGSNMRLGSGAARIRELLDAGAPVSLAVDGSASNDTNHLLAEARLMLLLARTRSKKHWLSAEEVWRVACSGGAKVLGRSNLGTLEAGALADLVLWDLDGLYLAGAQSDPLAALLFSAPAPRAHAVMVGGNWLVQDGKIPGFDEAAQAKNHNQAAAKLLDRHRKEFA
ncbi:8-oxoguanine deaminase [bacterium]|nr:8-oxoguanine deaminase [bacterium]